MMKLKLRDNEDPQEGMLTRLNNLAYGLSGRGTASAESMILQYFLGGLPYNYHLENYVLAGETLERDRLVTRGRGHYHSLEESQSISGEALVVETVSLRRSPKRIFPRLSVFNVNVLAMSRRIFQ